MHSCIHPHTSVLRRYSALKSLGEKKQCFNEYIQQKRNEEKEEERRKFKLVGASLHSTYASVCACVLEA